MQVLKKEFAHVKFPKFTQFAACDTCVYLKDRKRLSRDQRAKDAWEEKLDKHRSDNAEDRKIYEATWCAKKQFRN